jgi:hypothetical protein
VAHLIKPRCGNRRPIDRRAAGCRYLAPAKCGRCSSDLVCLAAAAFALGCKANKPARAPDGRSDGCVTPSALYGYHSAQGPEVTVRVHSQLTWPASQPIRDAYEPYIYIYIWLAAKLLFFPILCIIPLVEKGPAVPVLRSRQVNNDRYRVPLTIFRFFDCWAPCERKTTKPTCRRACV